jgi:thioredoxin reductase (NADPH)
MSNLESKIKNFSAEILIVGGGPSAFTAGLYAARAGRRTIVLQGRGASRLAVGYSIENYPGYDAIDSQKLLEKFKSQAEHFGAEVRSEDAIDFNLSSDPKYVVTRDSLFEAKAVILATGKPVIKEKMLPGEETLLGTGVSYCATCDGPLYRGATVAAFGSSDEAAEDVLALHQQGCRVEWIPGESNEGQVQAALMDEIKLKKIPVHWKTKVKEIVGQKGVEKLILEKEGKVDELKVAALFIFRKSLTSPLFVKAGLRLDHKQCLAVDRFQRTNLDGVFAAGDITCGGMQVVTAAGEGAVAAMQAVLYIRQKA